LKILSKKVDKIKSLNIESMSEIVLVDKINSNNSSRKRKLPQFILELDEKDKSEKRFNLNKLQILLDDLVEDKTRKKIKVEFTKSI
jgi:hypothetical protein